MLLKSEPYLTRGRAVKDDAVKSVGQRTKEQGLDNLVCLKQSWWSGVWNRCDRAVYVWGHNVQSRLRNGASNEATETMSTQKRLELYFLKDEVLVCKFDCDRVHHG